jgi:hypothetical protein
MKLPGFLKRFKLDRRTARPDLMAGVVLGHSRDHRRPAQTGSAEPPPVSLPAARVR